MVVRCVVGSGVLCCQGKPPAPAPLVGVCSSSDDSARSEIEAAPCATFTTSCWRLEVLETLLPFEKEALLVGITALDNVAGKPVVSLSINTPKLVFSFAEYATNVTFLPGA